MKLNTIPRSTVADLIAQLGFVPTETTRIEITPRWVDHHRADGCRIRYHLTQPNQAECFTPAGEPSTTPEAGETP